MNEGEVLELLRRQRHNFMNHLQVLYGYAQLQRKEAMSSYFEKLIAGLIQQGRINQVEDPRLAVTLLKWSILSEDDGVDLYLEIGKELHSYRHLADGDILRLDRYLAERVSEICQLEEEQRAIVVKLALFDDQLVLE